MATDILLIHSALILAEMTDFQKIIANRAYVDHWGKYIKILESNILLSVRNVNKLLYKADLNLLTAVGR